MSEPNQKSSWRTVSLRWLIALVVGFGGMYLIRRIILHVQARAATRVILIDFARFEGCLLGLPRPNEADAPDRVVALAEGTGDPVWPHTCSQPLTRLSDTVEDVVLDDSSVRPLATAVTHMESALAEAVFWTEHIRAGQHEAPGWIGAYIELRRAAQAFATSHSESLLAPEAPRRPRIPRDPDAGPVLEHPVALAGGTSADIVDATASVTEFAAILRDVRSRYELCRWPMTPLGADGRCEPFQLPNLTDPRYEGFVPTERGAHLAVWGRAPVSLRGLVDIDTHRVPLIAAGSPDAMRDYWVGPSHSMAIQITGEGASVLVGDENSVREIQLPASLDVLSGERALLGTTAGASEIWLDSRSRSRSVLRAVALGIAADPPGPASELASWREPRLTGIDRRLLACSVPLGPAYAIAGDSRGGYLFATHDGRHFDRAAEISLSLSDVPRVVCDAVGVSLIWSVETPPSLRVLGCDLTQCEAVVVVPIAGPSSVARVGGSLLVADVGAPESGPRVRSLSHGALVDSRVGEVPPPPVRDVRVASLDTHVALIAAGSQTYAWFSSDGGRTFVPAHLAQ